MLLYMLQDALLQQQPAGITLTEPSYGAQLPHTQPAGRAPSNPPRAPPRTITDRGARTPAAGHGGRHVPTQMVDQLVQRLVAEVSNRKQMCAALELQLKGTIGCVQRNMHARTVCIWSLLKRCGRIDPATHTHASCAMRLR